MSNSYDVIIIGAGIAGISLAANLPADLRALVLEMEERPAYHTTGRSAAMYEPNYGPPPMLAFTRASYAFFTSPPNGFADGPLFIKRDTLLIEADGQADYTATLLANGDALQEISEAAAMRIAPVLRAGYAKRTFLDPKTGDLDVDLLHGGYLRQFKANGGTVATDAEVKELNRSGGQWQAVTKHGTFTAPLLVNAAGAWGDVVAARAGVKPVGLIPKRRSIGIIPAPAIEGAMDLPMMTDVGETWYMKPQSGKLIVSSADATPVDPHDAYADDMAIAEGIDRLMTATTIQVERLEGSWGGLRTFTPDGSPAVGFDLSTDDFFWLVGQGGYGIQSAPALSRAAAAMLLGKSLPDDVLKAGLDLATIAPARFSA
jgi:D-arginine dehydrogenase